jgi:hypothetical protein
VNLKEGDFDLDDTLKIKCNHSFKPLNLRDEDGIAKWTPQSLTFTTMPHSTRSSSLSRAPTLKFPGDARTSIRTSMEKFPEMDTLDGQSPYTASPIRTNGYINGAPSVDRWQPRRDSGLREPPWTNGHTSTGGKGHGRQKSLSDAFRTIRTRNGSVSANVHEISDALKAPVSPKLIVRSTTSTPPHYPQMLISHV